MPTKKVVIKSKKKANFGEPVEVDAYYWTPSDKLLGVLFGHFAPFTGEYGHVRMMREAQKRGVEDFVVVMPKNSSPLDADRNLFTDEQRVKIVKEGCKELGINLLDCWVENYSFPGAVLGMVQRRYQDHRIILCCGPDRAKEYERFAVPYRASNTPFLDPDDPNFRKQEMIVCNDRGVGKVSGTLVREILKTGTVGEFTKVTGYSPKMWMMMRGFIQKNGVVSLKESFFESYMGEAMEATKRVGIKHLYNPGNSQELSPLDFMDLLKEIVGDGGMLEDGDNVKITEKSDGCAIRFGLDEDGDFFIEQSYSGPVYSADKFLTVSTEKFGGIRRSARGWSNLFTALKNDKMTQKALKEIFHRRGAFKIVGEVYITELGHVDADGYITFVGSRYDKSKLGSVATIILFDDGEDTQTLKKASSGKIKYDDAELVDKGIVLDVRPALTEIESNLEELKSEYGDLESILKNPSRKKEDLALKRIVKAEIENQQGILNDAISSKMKAYVGKWGPDYEGFVLCFKSGRMVKITSAKFKEFKSRHDDTMKNWLMELEK